MNAPGIVGSVGGRGLAAGLAVVSLCGAGAAAASGPQTVRVSVDRLGFERKHPSWNPDISADGGAIAYETLAADYNGDRVPKADVFVYDLGEGETDWVSANPLGLPGNGSSGEPSISADGRLVAFWSSSTDLGPEDGDGYGAIFVRDRVTRSLQRISDRAFGKSRLSSTYSPSLSGSGRYVAFASSSEQPNTLYRSDVHLYDRQTGAVELVAAGQGTGERADVRSPAISPDGGFVGFDSYSRLARADRNQWSDVFVRDRARGTITRVSVASGERGGNGNSWGGAVSAGGRFVAFTSAASNLVPGDENRAPDVFVRDRAAGTTRCVSVDSSGKPAGGRSDGASISPGGRYVSFTSDAADLVRGDTNGYSDVFVRDLEAGRTRRVSISTRRAEGDGPSEGVLGWHQSAIARDARFVAFPSLASNLAPDDTNDAVDIFVRGPLAP